MQSAEGNGGRRLWSGAGEALAAEGLRLDHCPDLVAIDIKVAHAHAIRTKSAVASMRLCNPSVSP